MKGDKKRARNGFKKGKLQYKKSKTEDIPHNTNENTPERHFERVTAEKFEFLDSQSSSELPNICLLYTSPSPRDRQKSRMPSSA